MKRLKLLPAARRELRDATRYYEAEQAGLGTKFATAIDDGFEQIRALPEAWAHVSPKCRRRMINGFPYGIVYRIYVDHILIVAIAHLRRDPEYWHDREI